MAPPRQRPAASTSAVIDDSRSEASSGTATGNPSRGVPGPKPRKSGIAAAAASVSTIGTIASSKDLKVAAATGAAAAAAAAAAAVGHMGLDYGDGLRDDLPGVCFPILRADFDLDSMSGNAH